MTGKHKRMKAATGSLLSFTALTCAIAQKTGQPLGGYRRLIPDRINFVPDGAARWAVWPIFFSTFVTFFAN
jgi:hypothetical protein